MQNIECTFLVDTYSQVIPMDSVSLLYEDDNSNNNVIVPPKDM